MKCPKCGYERKPDDDAPDWQCPSCKVAYMKVQAQLALVPKEGEEVGQANEPAAVHAASWGQRAVKPAVQQDVAASQQDGEEDDGFTEDELFEERCWLAAAGQKALIYSIIMNFVLNSAYKTQALSDVVLQVLFLCVAVYALTGVVKICSGLDKTQNSKILFMVLSFIPGVSLILWIYLSVKTSRMLRDAGWTVGLMGARP